MIVIASDPSISFPKAAGKNRGRRACRVLCVSRGFPVHTLDYLALNLAAAFRTWRRDGFRSSPLCALRARWGARAQSGRRPP